MADAVQRPNPAIPDGWSDKILMPEAGAHLRRVGEANRQFFEAEADAISRACRDMAKRFHRGGRLLVAGSGAGESDACHVSVEFLHPVLIGKPALPAMVLEGNAVTRIRGFGRPEDIAMGLMIGGAEARVSAMLEAARAAGMLTIVLAGRTAAVPVDYLFAIPEDNPLVIQEVQETCYHVLYELVHVFLEQERLS